MDRKTLEKIKPLLASGDIKATNGEGYTLTKTGIEKLVNEYIKVSQVEKPVISDFAGIIEIYGLDCPQCPNTGCYGESISRYEYDDNGLPTSCYEDVEAAQCEFCYTEPRSKFNLTSDIEKVLASKISK